MIFSKVTMNTLWCAYCVSILDTTYSNFISFQYFILHVFISTHCFASLVDRCKSRSILNVISRVSFIAFLVYAWPWSKYVSFSNFYLKCLPSLHVALSNFHSIFVFIPDNILCFLLNKYALVTSFLNLLSLSMIIRSKFTGFCLTRYLALVPMLKARAIIKYNN